MLNHLDQAKAKQKIRLPQPGTGNIIRRRESEKDKRFSIFIEPRLCAAPFSMGSITDSGWNSSRVHPENLKCWVDAAEQRYPMFRSVSQSGIGRRWSNAYDIYFAIPISAYTHLIPEECLYFSGFNDIKDQDLDLIVMTAVSILE